MKKIFASILMLAMVLSITACNSTTTPPANSNVTSADQSQGTVGSIYPKMTIEMAVNNSGSPDEACLNKFAELIKERSGGSITCVMYAGTLGSETEIMEQIRANTIHMV